MLPILSAACGIRRSGDTENFAREFFAHDGLKIQDITQLLSIKTLQTGII